MDLEKIQKRIFASTEYQKLKEETDLMLTRVEEFVELVKDKTNTPQGREAVLAVIWKKLMETGCNYVYCSMIMYNLWRTCFRETQYEDFIAEVNKIICGGC